jgi:hypothetical protein
VYLQKVFGNSHSADLLGAKNDRVFVQSPTSMRRVKISQTVYVPCNADYGFLGLLTAVGKRQ